jgi:hypothetical protein
MRALIVFESMFGNSEVVARAVGEGLAAGGCTEVDLTRVDRAPTQVPDGVDLVLVGGPTHAFGMTRQSSREEAVRQGAPASGTQRGIREWVDLVHASPSVRFATFDTRMDRVRRLPGSAAHQASRHLRRRGFRLASGPTSYYVSSTTGPLGEDETGKARRWGEAVARNLVATRAGR